MSDAGVQSYGFKAAGTEWLAALHAAQREARQIQRTKGIPDNRGKIKFFVAPAEEFVNESRRVLHANNMGWFRESTQLNEINPHTGSLKLSARFVVYHAPSGQAQTFVAEWSSKSDGDSMASAHTRVTRRFVQGLLQIAVVDEGLTPEDPPGGWNHAQHPAQAAQPPRGLPPAAPQQPMPCQHPRELHAFAGNPVYNQNTQCWVDEIVCTGCGSITGEWGPCAAPASQPAPAPAPAPQQQSLPPVMSEPVVQQAMNVLGAAPVSQKQMNAEMRPGPQADSSVPPDAWRDILCANGLDPEEAKAISCLDDSGTVEPELVEKMRTWAYDYYKGDTDKILAAWSELGFVPATHLDTELRPRPTGLQTKKFLSAIKFPATTKPA